MRSNPRFLLWVYLLVFGMVIIFTLAIFVVYIQLASTTDKVTDTESFKAAVTNLGTVAQAFADLVKVALGAVIGALSAILQSVLSEGTKVKTSEEEKSQEAISQKTNQSGS